MEEASKVPRTALINISHVNNNLLSYPAIYVDMQMKNGWFCRDLRIPIPEEINLEIQKEAFGYHGLPSKDMELEFKNHKDQISVIRFRLKFTLDPNDSDMINFPRAIEFTHLGCEERGVTVTNARLEVNLVLGRQVVGENGLTDGDFIRTEHRNSPYRNHW